MRLACQLRPTAPLTVTILNRPAVPGPFQVEFIEVKSVVAAHARAVLGNETAEIESADPAAITRWFAGKFPFPVVVPNLSSAGFSLRGARVDYLQDRPVPALVFARNDHAISLYLVPSNDSGCFRRARQSDRLQCDWMGGHGFRLFCCVRYRPNGAGFPARCLSRCGCLRCPRPYGGASILMQENEIDLLACWGCDTGAIRCSKVGGGIKNG